MASTHAPMFHANCDSHQGTAPTDGRVSSANAHAPLTGVKPVESEAKNLRSRILPGVPHL